MPVKPKYSNMRGWATLINNTLDKLKQLNVEPYYIYQKYDELRMEVKLTGDKIIDQKVDEILTKCEDSSLEICVYCGKNRKVECECK